MKDIFAVLEYNTDTDPAVQHNPDREQGITMNV